MGAGARWCGRRAAGGWRLAAGGWRLAAGGGVSNGTYTRHVAGR
ncbi:MAG TPA: hypothetical protein VH021_22945 [Trebonia sp.]|nr:hypothetical protein [Trebonia sp.]